MFKYYPKYNVFETMSHDYPVDVRHAQVACLYWKFHKDIDSIVAISGYSISTVKSYVTKYSEDVEKYDEFFNPDAPAHRESVRSDVPVFCDDYTHVTAEPECGLYLIGSTYFDPLDEDKKYYWIKVGMSTNLTKRVKGYATENPMYWLADTLHCGFDIVGDMEHACHIALSDIAYGIAKNTDEWFLVTKEQYFEICSKGFKYFFEF